MISPISFGSIYKVQSSCQSLETKQDNVTQLVDYCYNNGVETIDVMDPKRKEVITTIYSPDDFDEKLESYCAVNGIKYNKCDTVAYKNIKNIEDRVDKPRYGYETVYVEPEKFDEYLYLPGGNAAKCEDDYKRRFKEQCDNEALYAKKVSPSTVKVYFLREGLAKLAKMYGDDYKKEMTIVKIDDSLGNNNQCMYFALRDCGCDKVPIFVDGDTKSFLTILGVLDE